MSNPSFSTLGVAEPILRALQADNYVNPTPIQQQIIPLALNNRDVLGIAQTGTGKTAAFGIPLLQHLATGGKGLEPKIARALILAPTRELAVQIHESLRKYGRHLSLRHAVILGGVNQSKQVGAMRRGVDVLVATPGRLLDLVQQKHVRLDGVTRFVIDEADRMFDMGFIQDVRKIVGRLPQQRQSMLFSATMPREVAHLVDEILTNPARVNITPTEITSDRIEQQVHFVAAGDKRGLLLELLSDDAMQRVIVFTRTKHGADKVVKTLEKSGHKADALHGGKSQNARQRALNEFRKGAVRILVATDIAARGIDVDQITHVVNFELPPEAENYVHRIGRTARAGNAGIAVTLCDPSERDQLRRIERLLKRKLTIASGEDRAAEKTTAPGERTYRPKNRRPNRRRSRQGRPARRAA